jgi:cell wall-associated NlpC family hydrolase
MEKIASKVDLIDIKEGDIVVFKYGLTTTHAGVYVGNGRIIHSAIRHGVIEEKLDKYITHFDSVWRLNKCHQ